MADRNLLQHAAQCYLDGGAPADAARCLVAAEQPERAIDILVGRQMFRAAAEVCLTCGRADHGGWLLADRVGDIPAARAVVDEHGELAEAADEARIAERLGEARAAKARAIDAQDWLLAERYRRVERELHHRNGRFVVRLRWRLVLARCDAAEGVGARRSLGVLLDAQHTLAGAYDIGTQPLEEWAVSVATAMRRLDQVALLFAASVRGRRGGAVVRWREWSERTLGEELVLPPGVAEGGDR